MAVVGGATAGAEVASRLADRGVRVAVFEQNDRPYGKIEDGLPRWHEGLRNKEYKTIGTKLSQEGVSFVPDTKIGRDVAWKDLVDGWGFSCVVLANGAWRDRPLPIDGADEWIGKGLVYQNPFVIAFNHDEDASYDGETFGRDRRQHRGGGWTRVDRRRQDRDPHDDAREARRARHRRDHNRARGEGIPKTLANHDLSWEDLGLTGCTIYYRRREEDMPLVEIPADAPPERVEKIKKSRRTMLDKAMQKFHIRVEPLSAPDSLIIEDDRVVGLVFRRTKLEDGRVKMTDETYERRGPVVISSIGSIPEAIEGIPMKGELFDFADWTYGRLDDFPTVFSVGNVVTGKGNIVASRKHASLVSQEAIEAYLGVADEGADATADSKAASQAAATAEAIADHLEAGDALDPETIAAIDTRIGERQAAVGYEGDLAAWLARVGEPC